MSVSLVAPFIVLVLGVSVLKEKVGLRRLIAVILGFSGTLAVIRSGQDVLHPAIFLVVGGAFFFASWQVPMRFLHYVDLVATMVACTVITGISLITLILPFVLILLILLRGPYFSRDWLLLVMIRVLLALAGFSVVKILNLAQYVLVASMN